MQLWEGDSEHGSVSTSCSERDRSARSTLTRLLLKLTRRVSNQHIIGGKSKKAVFLVGCSRQSEKRVLSCDGSKKTLRRASETELIPPGQQMIVQGSEILGRCNCSRRLISCTFALFVQGLFPFYFFGVKSFFLFLSN